MFHRRIERIERSLDANECEQDGSEIRSVKLERLIAQGLTLIERRNSFEFMRDAAVHLYEMHTGEAWRPRCGSMVSRRTLTAARAFLGGLPMSARPGGPFDCGSSTTMRSLRFPTLPRNGLLAIFFP